MINHYQILFIMMLQISLSNVHDCGEHSVSYDYCYFL